MVSIPVSTGELFDKISILEIKTENIKDSVKFANVKKELTMLLEFAKEIKVDEEDIKNLKEVNQKLWNIEDEIRECERTKDFGPKFIELARSVYMTNDERMRLKTKINDQTGSSIIEEKSYVNYKS